MAGRRRVVGMCILLLALIVAMFATGCQKKETPENVKNILYNLREGYNDQDYDQFIASFSSVMMNKRDAEDKIIEMMDKTYGDLGRWESEELVRNIDNVWVWKVKFERGKRRLEMVINDQNETDGCHFKK